MCTCSIFPILLPRYSFLINITATCFPFCCNILWISTQLHVSSLLIQILALTITFISLKCHVGKMELAALVLRLNNSLVVCDYCSGKKLVVRIYANMARQNQLSYKIRFQNKKIKRHKACVKFLFPYKTEQLYFEFQA